MDEFCQLKFPIFEQYLINQVYPSCYPENLKKLGFEHQEYGTLQLHFYCEPKYLVYFFKDMFKRFENLVTETVEYRKMPLIRDIINKKKA